MTAFLFPWTLLDSIHWEEYVEQCQHDFTTWSRPEEGSFGTSKPTGRKRRQLLLLPQTRRLGFYRVGSWWRREEGEGERKNDERNLKKREKTFFVVYFSDFNKNCAWKKRKESAPPFHKKMALNYSKWDSLEEYDEVSDDSDDDQGSISRPKLPAGYLEKSNPHGKSTMITVPWEVSSGENKMDPLCSLNASICLNMQFCEVLRGSKRSEGLSMFEYGSGISLCECESPGCLWIWENQSCSLDHFLYCCMFIGCG